MKNTFKLFEAILWIAIIAFIAIIGLGFTACGNGSTGGSDTPRTAKFVSVDGDGDTWKLTIKEKTARFAYSPQRGDSYELEVDSAKDGKSKSKGQVQSNTNGKIKMKPANATDTFEVTTNAGSMTSVSGKVTFDDGEFYNFNSPYDLTPVSGPGGATINFTIKNVTDVKKPLNTITSIKVNHVPGNGLPKLQYSSGTISVAPGGEYSFSMSGLQLNPHTSSPQYVFGFSIESTGKSTYTISIFLDPTDTNPVFEFDGGLSKLKL